MIKSIFGILLVFTYSQLCAQQDIKHVKGLLNLVNRNIENNFQKAIVASELALTQAREIDYREGMALAYYYLGKIYGSKLSDFIRAISYHEKSVILAQELSDNKLIAENFLSSGLFHYHLGLYGKALEQLLQSRDIFKSIQDLTNASFAQVTIAAIYAESGKESYSKSILEFEEVIQYATSAKNELLFITAASYYTTALVAHEQFSEAEKYLTKVLSMAKKDDKYAEFTQMLYLNLGDIFFNGGMLKATLNQYEMAKRICETNGIKYRRVIILFKLGKAYSQLDEVELARRYYKEAIQDFKRLHMNIKLIEVYNAWALLESQQSKFEEAFDLKSLASVLRDSLYTNQSDFLVEAQSQVASKKINIQQKAEQISWLSINLILFVLLGVFFSGLVYLNHQRLRAAKNRSMLVNENVILEKELQNNRLQEEKLIQQLEFNAKTLTTNTLNIIQKNEILLQIKDKADILRNSFPEELLPIKVKDLIHLVNFGLNIDKDWDNFKIYFEQVHTGFFDQLKNKYPHLNSSDLKLCALLKLNLDTKEIAAIMNISPPSVKVARSRLRKKLELGVESNLSSFITQIQ